MTGSTICTSSARHALHSTAPVDSDYAILLLGKTALWFIASGQGFNFKDLCITREVFVLECSLPSYSLRLPYKAL